MNSHDVNIVRDAMNIHDIYDEDENIGDDGGGDDNDNGDSIFASSYPPDISRIGSPLDVTAELETRNHSDQWKEDDPWKSTDSLCNLVDQFSKPGEQPGFMSRQQSSDDESTLRKTWKSSGSLSNLIESTTNSLRQTWKSSSSSSDSLSNLVEKYSITPTTSTRQSSYGSKFNASSSSSQTATNTHPTPSNISTSRSSFESEPKKSSGANINPRGRKASIPVAKAEDEIVAGDNFLVQVDSYYDAPADAAGDDSSTSEPRKGAWPARVRSFNDLFSALSSPSASKRSLISLTSKRSLVSNSRDSTTRSHGDIQESIQE